MYSILCPSASASGMPVGSTKTARSSSALRSAPLPIAPGKPKPGAIGNGALLSADDERAVFVEPTGIPEADALGHRIEYMPYHAARGAFQAMPRWRTRDSDAR